MDALKLMKTEHDMFKDLLTKLDETTERAVKTRQETFARLKAELVSHEEMEEQIFYPALQEARKKAKDIVLEGYEEHHVADLIVAELSSLPVDEEQWSAKLSVLKESIEHHIEEEEGEMFEHARKAFDAKELDALGEQMKQVKEAKLRELIKAA
jgi:hemerythrin-like domain-containing protein